MQSIGRKLSASFSTLRSLRACNRLDRYHILHSPSLALGGGRNRDFRDPTSSGVQLKLLCKST